MSVIDDHAVETIGSGARTLVLVHGYGCDKNMWSNLLPHLGDDYTIVLYDLMGAGASNLARYDTERYATLGGHADDLIAILDALGTDKATLVGHSVSAMTVALVANAVPDRIEAVVLICPSPSYINDGDYEGGFERADILGLLETLDANYLGWASEMAPAIMGAPDTPEHGERLRASFCQTDPVIARHFAHVTFLSDHRDDVSRLRQQTLILQCRDDVIVPSGVGDWLQSHIPHASLIRLRATGHCPHISFPEETAAAMTAFLTAA